MQPKRIYTALFVFSLLCPLGSYAQSYYEISGSPYATHDAPLPEHIKPPAEKLIVVDPSEHVWGAYSPKGKLIRWGIATAGADYCADLNTACRTKSGSFRIHSLGNGNCVSSKFPLPGGGAPMPYCMYFNGSQALHGSNDVEYDNVSHGCIRVHIDDAEWLRYHFVEGPNLLNGYRGTKMLIKSYPFKK
jgi:L,D-transpeptidase ErfK/SrfK